jgi:hypothetical protein
LQGSRPAINQFRKHHGGTALFNLPQYNPCVLTKSGNALHWWEQRARVIGASPIAVDI